MKVKFHPSNLWLFLLRHSEAANILRKYQIKIQLEAAEKHGVDPKWIDPDGNVKWPPNNGFDGKPTVGTLDSPAEFDRYGGYINDEGKFVDTGTFTSPTGVPFEHRSVTPATLNKPYRKYEVIKPIPNVQSGKAAPWFDQPGGGIQYNMPMKIKDLIKGGYIAPKG